MSSSRNRNFRRRPGSSSDDENDSSAAVSTPVPKPPPPRKPPSSSSAKPKKQSLLSFADDEVAFSPLPPRSSTSSSSKRPPPSSTSSSSSSSKFTKPVKDRNTPPTLLSNNQPQAGTYTKEALLELQKNTKTLTPRPVSAPPKEPVIVLKGLLKPPKDAIEKESKKSEEVEEEEEDNIRSFPDQKMIDAIKAKRDRMRQAKAAAPDYIALDSGSNHGEAEGLSDEEPEFRGRIGLIGGELKKGGVFESNIDNGFSVANMNEVPEAVVVPEEEDEEDRIWEEEQFRKALGKKMMDESVPGTGSVSKDTYAYAYAAAPPPAGMVGLGGLSIGAAAVGGFPGPEVMTISQQAEITRRALRDNVMRLKESHGRTLTSLTRTDENMSASVLKVTALEKALSAAGEKFIFMQKLREFVSVICDFLQHKAPFIEELEEQMQKLHEERAAIMLERRSADNKDEMVELEAAVNAAVSIFNKSGNTSAMIEAATRAAQVAANTTKEGHDLPLKLDELGRDLNLQKRMDITRRADARKRRKARTDAKRLASMDIDGAQQRIEGESSTDESDSETAAYQSNQDMLLQTAEQIFSDATDEFSQLSLVMERFEMWKKDYPSSYQDAYMSLSIPSIFSPYVRLELLKWDPLHKKTRFTDMKWHSLLFSYGIDDDVNANPDDADDNLVPHLVEKVAVPILHHSIAHCWDMLSCKETKNAVFAMQLVVDYLPASSGALVELVSVLHDRLADAVADLTVPTWKPLVMKAVPNAARVAAYRFGTSLRLLRNVGEWKKVIALPALEKLALDDLLSGKILPHLRSIQSNVHDAVTRSERVIDSLSDVWIGPNVVGPRSPKLQPLVSYLLSLGRTLENKHVSGVTESESSGLPRRLKKMLFALDEFDHARAISKTFNLKEAV